MTKPCLLSKAADDPNGITRISLGSTAEGFYVVYRGDETEAMKLLVHAAQAMVVVTSRQIPAKELAEGIMIPYQEEK